MVLTRRAVLMYGVRIVLPQKSLVHFRCRGCSYNESEWAPGPYCQGALEALNDEAAFDAGITYRITEENCEDVLYIYSRFYSYEVSEYDCVRTTPALKLPATEQSTFTGNAINRVVQKIAPGPYREPAYYLTLLKD